MQPRIHYLDFLGEILGKVWNIDPREPRESHVLSDSLGQIAGRPAWGEGGAEQMQISGEWRAVSPINAHMCLN